MNPEPASEQPTSLSPFAVEPRNPPPLPQEGAPKEDFADDDLAVVRPRPLWPTLVVAAVASLFVGGAATAYASKSAPKHQVQVAAAMAPALPPLESRKIPPPPAHVDVPPVAPAAPVSDVPVSAVMDAAGARADSPIATPVKAAAPPHHASTPAPATPKAHAAPPPAGKKASPPPPAKPIPKAKPVEAKKAAKAPPAKKKS